LGFLLSGEHVGRLKRRARSFLIEAERVDDPDLSLFFAEQAIQLYVKAVYFELFGGRIRGHRIREMLGLLAKSLEAEGFKVHASRVLEFIAQHRDNLIILEEAYSMSRYGDIEYSKDDASLAILIAKSLVNLLEEVCRDVKLG